VAVASGTTGVASGASVSRFLSVSAVASVCQVASVSGSSLGGSGSALLTELGQRITTEGKSPLELEKGP
jgi:hypothetical protein